jgi:uncharacterized RDD family membrane protein YckC
MQMPEAPGWYDDPEQPDQLRYFDGVVWTQHVTPRRTRTGSAYAGQQPAGEQAPAAGGGQAPTAGSGQAPEVATRHPSQQSWHQPQGWQGGGQPPGAQPPGAQPPEAPQDHWYPGGQQYQGPAQGQPPGQPPPWTGNQPGAGWPAPYAGQRGPTTPDGVPLASYGVRVGAFFMDGVIRYLLVLLLGGYFFYQAIQPVMDTMSSALARGDVQGYLNALEQVDAGWMLGFSLFGIAVAVVYNVFFLVRWGATPGKRLAGISVRLRDQPGTLTVSTALRRYGFVAVIDALGNVPGVSLLSLPLWALDHLFPVWDPQRQALHDKVAGTVVVVGRQPPRRRG